MTTHTPKLLGLSFLTTALVSFTATVSAASVTPLVDFQFNEGSGTKVTDSIASLVGTPGEPSNPPTFVTDSPSGKAGDTAVHFESGQYFQVNDSSTQIKFDPNNPNFTLQAWVWFETKIYYAKKPLIRKIDRIPPGVCRDDCVPGSHNRPVGL